MKVFAVVVLLLTAASTLADDSKWLPLAVGNSWTYGHHHTEYYSHNAKFFTIEVLRTEEVSGKTYFVFSDLPDNLRPVPVPFIAGKKLRWSGSDLMELTESGERILLRFGGFSPAQHDIWGEIMALSYDYNGAIRVNAEEWAPGRIVFRFLRGSEHIVPREVLEWMYVYLPRNPEAGPGPRNDQAPIGPSFDVLYGFGIWVCSISVVDSDVSIYKNNLVAESAVVEGVEIMVRDAYERAGDLSTSGLATGVTPKSWGQIKRPRP